MFSYYFDNTTKCILFFFVFSAMAPNGLFLKSKSSIEIIPMQILPLSKYHFCVLVSLNELSLFLNGTSLHTASYVGKELLGSTLRIYFGGGEQWPNITPMAVGTPYINDNAFVFRSIPRGAYAGTIIDPKVWNVNLNLKEIADLSLCETIAQSSISLEWTFEGSNIESSNASIKEQCRSEAINYMFLSKALTFDANQIACDKLGLSLLSPQYGKEYNQLIDDTRFFHDVCGKEKWYAWLKPISDQLVNNKRQIDSCEALTISGQESISCQETICSGCQIKQTPKLFILRGICPLKIGDLSFLISRSPNQLGFYFYGLERYNITQDGDTWWLGDKALDTYVASTSDPVYPIGVRNWTIETNICGHKKGNIITVSLSPCDENEAVCGDGTCVSLMKRCDSFPDCPDASDEKECQSIRPSSIVALNSPPEPSPTKVQAFIDIVKVLTVPPLDRFSLLLELKFSWTDSRVTVTNISPGRVSPLSPQNPQIWRPKIASLVPGRSSPIEVAITDIDAGAHVFISPKSEGTTWTALTFSKPILDTRKTPFRGTYAIFIWCDSLGNLEFLKIFCGGSHHFYFLFLRSFVAECE